MIIKPYDHSMKPAFSRLLSDYFPEVDSDIPEEIIRGKLMDLIEREYLDGIIHICVALDRSNPVGFSIYQIDSTDSDWCKRPGWGFIREFYICPAYRRKGCGRILAQHTLCSLRSLGAKQTYLTAGTAAEAFWLRCGWSRTEALCSNGLPILEKQEE